AALLSTTGIFIRYLTRSYGIPALVLALWRDAFVVLTLLPILALVRPLLLQPGRRHLLFLLGYGFVLAVFNALWTVSVVLNGAAIATVLVYSSAAFSVLLGWLFLRESLHLAKLAALAFALGGCLLVSGALDRFSWHLISPSEPVGVLIGLLSGLSYALYSLLGRSAALRGLSPWTTLVYIFGFAGIFLLLANLSAGGLLPATAARPAELFWLGRAWGGWAMLFLLAAGPTVAGFGLYNISLGYLPSSMANLIVTSEPALTAVTAYFVLGERMDPMQIGGGVMILAGVVFLRVSEGRRGLRIGRPAWNRPGAASKSRAPHAA
ncbi:MAG: DMT family transporter, partial [Candidatus Eisenbacteria bacterium]